MSMWEPFTAQARDAMVEAQKVAEQHGDSLISQHHIFIAISDAPDVAQIFAAMGVDRDRIQKAGKTALGEEGVAVTKEMTFTSEAKRMIEFAFDNARKLDNSFIGAEHLALGYIDLGRKDTQIISDLEIDPEQFRALLVASLEKKPKHSAGAPPRAQSKHSLEDCFSWVGRRKFGALLPEAMWDALSGAAAEKDVGAAIAYAFLIAHQNGWSAEQTASHVLEAAKRRFQN